MRSETILKVIFLVGLVKLICGSHFRGGTISWKSIGGYNVEFKFKMSWSHGLGPGCTEQKIGQYVHDNFIGDKFWKCAKGCGSLTPNVGPAFYTCTGADKVENWEQGENTFNYTFEGNGPFTASYKGAMWMPLTVPFSNRDGAWNLQTIINLNKRSDTGLPNNSPVTASKPLYTLQFECQHKIVIPMVDPDGDNVRCRWAVGDECHSICNGVPVATLDEDTCTLSFDADNTNFRDNGWYAAALTIEDFSQTPMVIGNTIYNTTTPITSVPLQFLIHIVKKPMDCNWRPMFIPPSPAEGSYIPIAANGSIITKLYASNVRNRKANVTSISLTSPPGMTHTGPFPVKNHPGEVYWNLQWTPKASQKGDNILCGTAEDSSGQLSDTHCFTYIAWGEHILNYTFQLVIEKGSSQNYECFCPGYIGRLCDTDIDECQSTPCLHGGTCTDLVNSYLCTCNPGYSGDFCHIEIDECTSTPCQHGGICKDLLNGYTCSCQDGFTGINCQTKEIGCTSSPCIHGQCKDLVNGYRCDCISGYSGTNCQTGYINASNVSRTRVAVYAFVDRFPIDLQQNEIVKFKNARTNVGNSYNPATGIFTCNVNGHYMFFVNMHLASHKPIEGELVKNGAPVLRTYSSGNVYDGAGTNMAVLRLSVGDKLWFKVHARFTDGSGVAGIIDGPWTSFSAVLLF